MPTAKRKTKTKRVSAAAKSTRKITRKSTGTRAMANPYWLVARYQGGKRQEAVTDTFNFKGTPKTIARLLNAKAAKGEEYRVEHPWTGMVKRVLQLPGNVVSGAWEGVKKGVGEKARLNPTGVWTLRPTTRHYYAVSDGVYTYYAPLTKFRTERAALRDYLMGADGQSASDVWVRTVRGSEVANVGEKARLNPLVYWLFTAVKDGTTVASRSANVDNVQEARRLAQLLADETGAKVQASRSSRKYGHHVAFTVKPNPMSTLAPAQSIALGQGIARLNPDFSFRFYKQTPVPYSEKHPGGTKTTPLTEWESFDSMREAYNRGLELADKLGHVVYYGSASPHQYSVAPGRGQGKRNPYAYGPWKSMVEVKEANKAAGYHFFDSDTLKFFKTKLHGGLYQGRYFIDSSAGPDGRRTYNLRRVEDSGRITTVRTGFISLEAARYAAKTAGASGHAHSQVDNPSVRIDDPAALITAISNSLGALAAGPYAGQAQLMSTLAPAQSIALGQGIGQAIQEADSEEDLRARVIALATRLFEDLEAEDVEFFGEWAGLLWAGMSPYFVDGGGGGADLSTASTLEGGLEGGPESPQYLAQYMDFGMAVEPEQVESVRWMDTVMSLDEFFAVAEEMVNDKQECHGVVNLRYVDGSVREGVEFEGYAGDMMGQLGVGYEKWLSGGSADYEAQEEYPEASNPKNPVLGGVRYVFVKPLNLNAGDVVLFRNSVIGAPVSFARYTVASVRASTTDKKAAWVTFTDGSSRVFPKHKALTVEMGRVNPGIPGLMSNPSWPEGADARELILYGENDGNLYRQRFMPIVQNFNLKVKNGKYNRDLSLKLWNYFTEAVIQGYRKEYGLGKVDKATKGEMNEYWRDKFEEEYMEGRQDGIGRSNNPRTIYWDDLGLGVYRLIDNDNEVYGNIKKATHYGAKAFTASLPPDFNPKIFDTPSKAAEYVEKSSPVVQEYVAGLYGTSTAPTLWEVKQRPGSLMRSENPMRIGTPYFVSRSAAGEGRYQIESANPSENQLSKMDVAYLRSLTFDLGLAYYLNHSGRDPHHGFTKWMKGNHPRTYATIQSQTDADTYLQNFINGMEEGQKSLLASADVHTNPKYLHPARAAHAARYARGTRPNPNSAAADVYEMFHGAPSTKVLQWTEERHVHEHVGVLGDLIRIRLGVPESGASKPTLECEGSGIFLCATENVDEDGGPVNPTLELRGGNCELIAWTLDGQEGVGISALLAALNMGSDTAFWKDAMLIARLSQITYRTQKSFDEFEDIDYYHKLGEEGGTKPFLLYHPRENRLSLAGGEYEVKPEGIVN